MTTARGEPSFLRRRGRRVFTPSPLRWEAWLRVPAGMRGRECIRVPFITRRMTLWWLLACCGVGAQTAVAASSTLLVFSGGQDAAAVMAQRDAFAAARLKSGNEQLVALRHWYLEAEPNDLFPLPIDQAYMATVLGDVMDNVTHTEVVVSFGSAASQVAPPSSPGPVEGSRFASSHYLLSTCDR